MSQCVCIKFSIDGHSVYFYLDDAAAASALRKLSRRITDSEGYKVLYRSPTRFQNTFSFLSFFTVYVSVIRNVGLTVKVNIEIRRMNLCFIFGKVSTVSKNLKTRFS